MSSSMKVYVMIMVMLLSILSVSLVQAATNQDASDPNRIYKPLYNPPMRCGGGYPSTNDNPSGGGRWND